jgi:hypothetical protein
MTSGRVGRACRGLLATCLAALVVTLCAAAAAQARTESFKIGFTADLDGRGSVSGTYVCQPANAPISDCPAGWTLQLERAGQVLGAATGRTGDPVGVGSSPQASDVVRFVRTGLADVVVTYDGLPAFDDTSCAMLGRRAVSGTVAGSHPTFAVVWVASLPYPLPVSRVGDRFEAGVPGAFTRGDVVMAISEGTQARSPSQALIVRSQRFARICGLLSDAPVFELNVTGPLKKVRIHVRKDGRFTLRRNRLDCPAGVPHCKVSVGTYRQTRRGLRNVGSLQYTVPADSRRRLKGTLSRRAMKRLARTKKTGVIVRVLTGLPPGDHQIKRNPTATILASLLAP